MNTLNRREMLRTSSVILMSPLLATLPAVPQVSAAGKRTATRPPFSGDLASYVLENLSYTVAKKSGGAAAPHDWLNASSAVRMLAHHVSEFGGNEYSKSIVDGLNESTLAALAPDAEDALYTRLQHYSKSIDRNTIHRVSNKTHAQIETTKNSVRANGVSWHLHSVADLLHICAPFERNPISPTSTGHRSHYPLAMPAVYDPSLQAHFMRVGLKASCKKALCKMLNTEPRWKDTLEFALGGLLAQMGALGACLAMAGGSILLTAATDGAAIGGVSLAAAGCELVTSGATIMAATGLAAGLAVNQAVDNWQAANCSQ